MESDLLLSKTKEKHEGEKKTMATTTEFAFETGKNLDIDECDFKEGKGLSSDARFLLDELIKAKGTICSVYSLETFKEKKGLSSIDEAYSQAKELLDEIFSIAIRGLIGTANDEDEDEDMMDYCYYRIFDSFVIWADDGIIVRFDSWFCEKILDMTIDDCKATEEEEKLLGRLRHLIYGCFEYGDVEYDN